MAAPTPVQATEWESNNFLCRRITIPVGGDADVTATKIIDISAYTTGVTGTTCDIRRIWWSLEGFAVNVFFDADTDVHALTLSSGVGYLDFSGFGITNTEATGYTGDIMITTSGVTAATDTGFFMIEVQKIA